MGSVKTLNPNAETMGRNAALFMNINAAKGLHEVMKTNFGPKGTIKMLVGGAGGKDETAVRPCKLGIGSSRPAHPVLTPAVALACRHQADEGWQRTTT